MTPAISPLHHAPGTDVPGHRCEPRVYADCRGCRRRVTFCMASKEDVAAIKRGGFRCADCAADRMFVAPKFAERTREFGHARPTTMPALKKSAARASQLLLWLRAPSIFIPVIMSNTLGTYTMPNNNKRLMH